MPIYISYSIILEVEICVNIFPLSVRQKIV